MLSWPRKIEGRSFRADFCARNFCGLAGRGVVTRYAATALIVALSPGLSDITRLGPWSTVTKENHFHSAKRNNSKSCFDDCHRWRFWFSFRHFGTHFAERFRMFKFSCMIDPTRSRKILSRSAIELSEIRRSFKIRLDGETVVLRTYQHPLVLLIH
jgi:hypothetical protein